MIIQSINQSARLLFTSTSLTLLFFNYFAYFAYFSYPFFTSLTSLTSLALFILAEAWQKLGKIWEWGNMGKTKPFSLIFMLMAVVKVEGGVLR